MRRSLRIAMASFVAADLSSYRNAEPEKASRPFDIDRDSGVISEGAGVFVLENLEAAEARGARPYLEITGYGKQRDRDPDESRFWSGGFDENGFSERRTHNRRRRLHFRLWSRASGAGRDRSRGTSSACSENEAYFVPVSSIKGVTGNALAAGGPFQLAACALTIRDQLIAPTTNYELPDPDCDLDFVPNRPRRSEVEMRFD